MNGAHQCSMLSDIEPYSWKNQIHCIKEDKIPLALTDMFIIPKRPIVAYLLFHGQGKLWILYCPKGGTYH